VDVKCLYPKIFFSVFVKIPLVSTRPQRVVRSLRHRSNAVPLVSEIKMCFCSSAWGLCSTCHPFRHVGIQNNNAFILFSIYPFSFLYIIPRPLCLEF